MKRKTLHDQLRQAMKGSGLTRYELSRRTLVPESTLSRFARGLTFAVSLTTADKLAEVLGLELRKVRKGR